MPSMSAARLVDVAAPESSTVVAQRVAAAWRHARERNGGATNAALAGAQLLRACALDAPTRATAKDVSAALGLTGRGIHRMLRVARTIADLDARGSVRQDDVLAATSLRDRSLEADQAA